MCSPTMAVPRKTPVCATNEASSRNGSKLGAIRPIPKVERKNTDENQSEVGSLPSNKTALRSCAHRPPVASSNAIRSRFLNRLGIQKEGPSSSARPVKRCLHRNSQDPKDTACSDEVSSSSSLRSRSSSISSNNTSTTRSVSFDDSVTVRPIPPHSAYPQEVKHQIWADPFEIYENATRNSIEFAADNFDWQHASEEDDFVPTTTGELVHPIHYIRQCNMQRNFLLVMAARQQQQAH
jgi:hypothetical protein